MYVRHHAARAAAADSFEHRKGGLHNLCKSLNRVALFWTKRQAGGGRNGQHTASVLCLELKNVSGESLQLLQIDRNDFATRRLESIQHPFTLPGICDRIGAENREPISDTHDHVCVQNRVAVLLSRGEGYGFI